MDEKVDESHVAALLFVTLCGIATFAVSIALGILFGSGWGWLTFAAIVAALAAIVLCAFRRMTGGDTGDAVEKTCSLALDGVHVDYVCSSCGGRLAYDFVETKGSDDEVRNVDMRFCPLCGAKVGRADGEA